MSPSTLQSSPITLPATIATLAEEAVEIVGVADVISEAADTIFAQIEACEAFASGSRDADAFFIATSLPIANAVIHLRTPRERLAAAREWARERWPHEKDPSVALAALVLVYMIGEGWKRYSKIAQKQRLWDQIRERVASLTVEPTPATAA